MSGCAARYSAESVSEMMFAEDFVVSGSDDNFDVEALNGSGQNTLEKRKITYIVINL